MNELINITTAKIGEENINAVNARDLWQKLESKRQFGDWIKDRLDGFTEGQDFTVHKIVKGSDGRFRPTEYIISGQRLSETFLPFCPQYSFFCKF